MCRLSRWLCQGNVFLYFSFGTVCGAMIFAVATGTAISCCHLLSLSFIDVYENYYTCYVHCLRGANGNDLKRIFHQVNSVSVSRNFWLTFLSKILIVFMFSLTYMKNYMDSKSVLIFLYSFSCSWFISNYMIFHKIKVAKHIWGPCCHLAAETGS